MSFSAVVTGNAASAKEAVQKAVNAEMDAMVHEKRAKTETATSADEYDL